MRRDGNCHGSPATDFKTNAVRASHPDRIVFAKSRCPSSTQRGMGESSLSPALRRVRAMMLLGRLSLAKQTSRINLQHYGGSSGQSCRVWRTLEEAATPGQPVRAEARVWKNPPDNSPSRITRNRWLCRNALAGQESRLNVDTVRYRSLTIKRKPEARCAEAVNVRSSLWKATENRTSISAKARHCARECTRAATTSKSGSRSRSKILPSRIVRRTV